MTNALFVAVADIAVSQASGVLIYWNKLVSGTANSIQLAPVSALYQQTPYFGSSVTFSDTANL